MSFVSFISSMYVISEDSHLKLLICVKCHSQSNSLDKRHVLLSDLFWLSWVTTFFEHFSWPKLPCRWTNNWWAYYSGLRHLVGLLVQIPHRGSNTRDDDDREDAPHFIKDNSLTPNASMSKLRVSSPSFLTFVNWDENWGKRAGHP